MLKCRIERAITIAQVNSGLDVTNLLDVQLIVLSHLS